ncbi:MAG: NYN domain-containing protein [Omnitrophica WOR_2 bacterium]
MKTYVYVDGFNLYYGAVKGTPYKWLDLARLCSLLLPKNQILKIKYFTALVNARPDDPDKPTRQQIYLRALHTIPNLEIIYGHFLEHRVSLPLANSQPGSRKYAWVINCQERT